MDVYESIPLAYVPDHFKTEEMCNLAMVRSPYTLKGSVEYRIVLVLISIGRRDV